MAGQRKTRAAERALLGHNSAGRAIDTAAAEELRAAFDRIQAIDAEMRGLHDKKGDVYGELRSKGYDLKTFRVVLSRAQQDRGAVLERDSMVDVYEAAIFGTTGDGGGDE
ncbi:MAG: DUF2312 domain-containing protein [Sneathiellaceae bacterium]